MFVEAWLPAGLELRYVQDAAKVGFGVCVQGGKALASNVPTGAVCYCLWPVRWSVMLQKGGPH